MPSDTRTAELLGLLASRHTVFRSALGMAGDEMRGWLRHRGGAEGGNGDGANGDAGNAGLGRFAAGRIDVSKFEGLFAEAPIAPDMQQPVELALAVVEQLLARGDDLFVLDLAPGADLRSAIEKKFAEIGRAFGAALVFQAVRLGTYVAAKHDALLAAMPFAQWNTAERGIAPPIVVELDGADLHGDALAGIMDGEVKALFVIRGARCAPAPLVRLVSPAVFVQQAAEVSELADAIAFSGPVVAALVPPGAARFTHDPRRGKSLDVRLTIAFTPETQPHGALGGRSAMQQRDELGQLAALATRGAAAMMGAVPETGPVVPQPPDAAAVENLTSWLLAQAGFAPGGTGAQSGGKAL